MFKAYKLKLLPEKENELKEQYKNLWQGIIETIHIYGGKNFSMFLDEKSGEVVCYIEVENEQLWKQCEKVELHKRWWENLSGILEMDEHTIPLCSEMNLIYHLP